MEPVGQISAAASLPLISVRPRPSSESTATRLSMPRPSKPKIVLRSSSREARTQRPQSTHPTNSEHDFLLYAKLSVSNVKPGRKLPILPWVFIKIGIQQINVGATHPHLPNSDSQSNITKLNLSYGGLTSVGKDVINRRRVEIKLAVNLFLATV